MKRIIVCTTPRTGSNLLVLSLANHPQAVNASEWFNNTMSGPAVENRQNRPSACNLLKLMFYDRKLEGFDNIYHSGLRVFLYRKDREAQLASWKKACATGLWLAEWSEGQPSKFPDNAEQQIKLADELFRPDCQMAISYEQLIEHWDDTIENVQRLAGWPLMKLPKALKQFPRT